MTDYSAATIDTGNSLTSGLVIAVGANRLQNIVDSATLTKTGTVTDTTDGWTFAANSGITLPDTSLTNYTLFVWAFATGSTTTLVSRSGGAGPYNQNYLLDLSGGITARATQKRFASGAYPTVSAVTNGTNGTLIKAASSFDGSTLKVYVNGTLSNSLSETTAPEQSGTQITQIGTVDGTERARSYNGNGIQLVLIWNRALSDAEQTSLSSNPDQVFNLSADTTAPVLTSPTGTQTGSTTATGTVSTNEANGTLYWLTNTSATATDAAIKAANSQPVTASGVQNVTSSGLTASTVYYNHFLHRDAAGNDSTRSTSASFTTAAPGGPVTGNDHGGEAMRSCMRLAMYPAMNQG